MHPFSPLDPNNAIEIAKTFFAGISAVAASISAWNGSRGRKEAAIKFDETFQGKLHTDETAVAAQQLVDIIPSEVLFALEKRAQTCWTFYRDTLEDDLSFLPFEIDNATVAVQACVCRELRRIKKLNGRIPSKWQGQWDQYSCADRNFGGLN